MLTIKTIGLFVFFLWGTHLVHGQQGIQINEKAPHFRAYDHKGSVINLDTILNKNKVVLLFYRGQWCPYCNRHMSALQDSLHLITEKDARVIAITPEKNDAINQTLQKTNTSFSIIYDENHQIMDAYDVTFYLSKSKHLLYQSFGINVNKASGNNDRALPVPATFIISEKGVVINRHFNKNYKVRMSVNEILKSLE